MREFIQLLRGGARSIARATVLATPLALLACSSDPVATSAFEAAPHATDQLADDRADDVTLRLGAREVRVRCALSCEDARAEHTRLRDACAADPTSTPHAVTAGDTSLVALGCCTEAATAYQRACGTEAIAACASRWLAECESGRLAP